MQINLAFLYLLGKKRTKYSIKVQCFFADRKCVRNKWFSHKVDVLGIRGYVYVVVVHKLKKIRMKQILIIILILISVKVSSQNDTLYLKTDHIVFRGEVYNETNSNKEKTGKWINYKTNYYTVPILAECASGYDKSGMDCHWYTNGTYVYRALRDGEKEEIRIIKKKSCDTINGSIYTTINAEIIRSKVAPDEYFLSSEGIYLKNEKSGLWRYYYETGEKIKTIDYLAGIPIESYSIYRRDGSVMLHVEKRNDSKWIVSKHKESGEKFEEKSGAIEDFKDLY